MQDNELMCLVQKGNIHAYEILVLRYRKEATLFAEKLLHDSYEAEDAVQEVFAKIYIHCSNYHTNSSFKGYLFTAVKNQCLDILRYRCANPLAELNDDVSSLYTEGPEYLTESKELTRTYNLMLSTLPENSKRPLCLRIKGMSYKEIAKLTGKTTSQVKITIFRARKKLKEEIKQSNIWRIIYEK